MSSIPTHTVADIHQTSTVRSANERTSHFCKYLDSREPFEFARAEWHRVEGKGATRGARRSLPPPPALPSLRKRVTFFRGGRTIPQQNSRRAQPILCAATLPSFKSLIRTPLIRTPMLSHNAMDPSSAKEGTPHHDIPPHHLRRSTSCLLRGSRSGHRARASHLRGSSPVPTPCHPM